ncbi:RagB/SusD family nutrient uptake outer membrane protein [Mucilaginibacter ginsenosidivorax]|uniref:RagB/SusD family nutrient uptake outer membrane protein n=1 Tax=Mucilaginibacter ginsenosidivorax TaxID=862126 RepID=A0A5B8WBN1_9SPHI|nr:RagB/SusD family nutrient uptake outer membrane protein [Mucilaginibacter ginsenosidivorax]QEC80225.1 RagB/SusD family nutrient uptake outer membrane protein [Mucilaginibacter ginsenosidivorax]
MKANIKYIISAAVISLVSVTGCKKDFFNRPPENAIAIDNFYKTDAQVASSTLNLYNSLWFNYVAKPGWAVCEMTGGNGRSYSSDVTDFGNLNGAVTNLNSQNDAAWSSLWTVVAQANALINLMPPRAGADVTPAVLNNALGEAHFMRAMAYFHIVRLWGAVPIIEDASNFLTNFQVNSNRIEDIYTFMVKDMKFAEANCTKMIRTGSITQGHVSSGSASAMLAKIYLYMQDYPNALAEAQKVINSGEFKLYGVDLPNKTYNDLFKTANNNNEESICQLQWAGGASYGHGNPAQASLAASGIITGTGDGYSVLGPTIDLQNSYEGGDLRLHATIMQAKDFYPEITAAAGGYTVPDNINSQGTDAAIKKYVVGTPADNGGIGAAQSAANNTYLMRYAEVYLIAAEAIVGKNTTSTDAQALNYINTIRKRANLAPLTVIKRNYTVANPNYDATYNNAVPTTIIKDDILAERRHEFAIENDYWFDLCRIDGWNGILNNSHPLATQLISQQERGTYANDRKTVYHSAVTPKSTDFLLPIPINETTADPKLLEPAVPYTFK